jgi:hypothetical protein
MTTRTTTAQLVRSAAQAGAAEDLASGLDPRRHRTIPHYLWPAHREALEHALGRTPNEVEELVYEKVWQIQIEEARKAA